MNYIELYKERFQLGKELPSSLHKWLINCMIRKRKFESEALRYEYTYQCEKR